MWSQVLSWHNSKYIKTTKEKSLLQTPAIPYEEKSNFESGWA
jgi:hypothetical protein